MDETHQEFKVQLYATDLDDEAIERSMAEVNAAIRRAAAGKI